MPIFPIARGTEARGGNFLSPLKNEGGNYLGGIALLLPLWARIPTSGALNGIHAVSCLKLQFKIHPAKVEHRGDLDVPPHFLATHPKKQLSPHQLGWIFTIPPVRED